MVATAILNYETHSFQDKSLANSIAASRNYSGKPKMGISLRVKQCGDTGD